MCDACNTVSIVVHHPVHTYLVHTYLPPYLTSLIHTYIVHTTWSTLLLTPQDMLHEVLGSVVSGRPIWREALEECQGDVKNNTELLKLHKNITEFIAWDTRVKV